MTRVQVSGVSHGAVQLDGDFTDLYQRSVVTCTETQL